jgi:hypothetical protein
VSTVTRSPSTFCGRFEEGKLVNLVLTLGLNIKEVGSENHL